MDTTLKHVEARSINWENYHITWEVQGFPTQTSSQI